MDMNMARLNITDLNKVSKEQHTHFCILKELSASDEHYTFDRQYDLPL